MAPSPRWVSRVLLAARFDLGHTQRSEHERGEQQRTGETQERNAKAAGLALHEAHQRRRGEEQREVEQAVQAADAPDGVAAQDYLGVEREYYRPTGRGFERELGKRLEAIRARLRAAKESE